MVEKAVFMDRDGTINEDTGYLNDPSQLKLIPGAAQAIAQAKKMGYKVIIITNQSGIARGIFSESTLERIHERLNFQTLKDAGMTMFAFNQQGDKNWLRASATNRWLYLLSSYGYYVYNPGPERDISLEISAPAEDFRIIRRGWNLLANSRYRYT